MPKPKKTEEEKQKDYDDWLAGPENTVIDEFISVMLETKYDNGTVDISDDWSKFLAKLH